MDIFRGTTGDKNAREQLRKLFESEHDTQSKSFDKEETSYKLIRETIDFCFDVIANAMDIFCKFKGTEYPAEIRINAARLALESAQTALLATATLGDIEMKHVQNKGKKERLSTLREIFKELDNDDLFSLYFK